MILVPKDTLSSFLLGMSASLDNQKRLIERLKQRMKRVNDDPPSRELLLQICKNVLWAHYTSDKHQDLHLGPIAVTAVLLQEASLFAKTIERTTGGFDEASYAALGEIVCLQDLVVSEDG